MRCQVLIAAALFLVPALADCPAPPPAQRDIVADGYYDDPPVNSHIDLAKHAAYEAAVKPLEDYLGSVARMASSGDKACTLRWLVTWAEGDAMLGKIAKEQAHYERKWVLSGLALSYAKVRDGASRDQKAAIDNWLLALADGVRRHSDAYKGTRNNHYYWEGLAVAATGAVTGNAKDLEWGRKVFHDAENDIADDGTLPLEMKRGSRALHYHLFAAEPLVMLESILDEHSAKLGKLIAFCIAGSADLDMVAKRAGVPQLGLGNGDLDWVTVVLRHNPPAPGNAIHFGNHHDRPDVTRLGGDLSKPNPLEHVGK
jgi:poly(beta-D-mannuronate) lyase